MSALTEFTEVPVIDVTGLLGDDPHEQWRVAQELGRAAREIGFLQVTGTGIDPALFEDLLRVSKAYFGLPRGVKMQTYIGRSRNHRGYVPVGEEVFSGGTVDLKEAFDLGRDLPADDPDHLAGRMLGPNQWPDVPGFAAACTTWYEAVMALGGALLRGFALALGEPADVFDAYVTKPPSQLRLIHYPYDPDAVDTVGIGAHTDYECFTILKPTAPGLEVLNGAGEWVDVPPLAVYRNPYRVGWEQFLRHVAADAPLASDFAAGIRDVAFAEACHRSMAERTWIAFPPAGKVP